MMPQTLLVNIPMVYFLFLTDDDDLAKFKGLLIKLKVLKDCNQIKGF